MDQAEEIRRRLEARSKNPQPAASWGDPSAVNTPPPSTPSSFSAPAAPVPSVRTVKRQEPESHGRTSPMKLVLVGVACLVIGYFAGREHIKYELRQAIASASEKISAAFGGNKPPAKTPAPDPTPAPTPVAPTPVAPTPVAPAPKQETRKAPFSVTLVEKGFMEHNYKTGVLKDAITFVVEFSNLTGKNIRAFNGQLTFSDLLDTKILSANFAMNDPVGAGQQIRWDGRLDINQFIASHQKLKDAEYKNIKISFQPRKILFDDGSTEEF